MKEIVKEWISKAEEDYKASLALNLEEFPNVICFHAQQCIEKYLKAVLVSFGIIPPKIHDLIMLNDILVEKDERFKDIYEDLEILNPYSVITRYPGEEASVDDAREAIDAMERSRNKIRCLISFL